MRLSAFKRAFSGRITKTSPIEPRLPSRLLPAPRYGELQLQAAPPVRTDERRLRRVDDPAVRRRGKLRRVCEDLTKRRASFGGLDMVAVPEASRDIRPVDHREITRQRGRARVTARGRRRLEVVQTNVFVVF